MVCVRRGQLRSKCGDRITLLLVLLGASSTLPGGLWIRSNMASSAQCLPASGSLGKKVGRRGCLDQVGLCEYSKAISLVVVNMGRLRSHEWHDPLGLGLRL